MSEPVISGWESIRPLFYIWAGIVLAGMMFTSAGCAHIDMTKYKAAFTACLTQRGLTDAAGVGTRIIGVLDQGGPDANTIESNLESVLISAGASAVEDVAVCAVLAWQAAHPVPAAGPQVKPTPAQAAARIFIARHTVKDHSGHSETGEPAGAHP